MFLMQLIAKAITYVEKTLQTDEQKTKLYLTKCLNSLVVHNCILVEIFDVRHFLERLSSEQNSNGLNYKTHWGNVFCLTS